MLKHDDTQMLSVKELAWRLNRHPNYVYLMRKAGFNMPGNRTTMEHALQWLEDNPDWRKTLPPPKLRAARKVSSKSPGAGS